MARYTFATDGVPSASQLNAALRDQVVEQCTSSTHPAGVTGQIIFETDTGYFLYYTGSAWVQLSGARQTYTPTLVQSSTVTFTNTFASYTRSGAEFDLWLYLTVTGTGSANATVTVTLPITAAIGGTAAVGSGWFIDSSDSTKIYPLIATLSDTTHLAFVCADAPNNNLRLGQTGASFAAAIANGDTLSIQATIPI